MQTEMLGQAKMQLPIYTPDKDCPRSPTSVWYPSGKLRMNWCALAFSAASSAENHNAR